MSVTWRPQDEASRNILDSTVHFFFLMRQCCNNMKQNVTIASQHYASLTVNTECREA